VPAYTVNEDAVRHAKRLIDAHQYVLRSRWQDVQPRAREQNAFLKTHSWEEYAAWHLGLTEGADEETKARYAFVYGDFTPLSDQQGDDEREPDQRNDADGDREPEPPAHGYSRRAANGERRELDQTRTIARGNASLSLPRDN
jgi:hypothetical protein